MTLMFLAGAEVETLTNALIDNGVKNILFSYFYIMQMRREQFIERIQNQHPEIRFFLDSGAFTYWMKWQSDQARLPPQDEYIRRFFEYIDQYGERYCRIAEPDLDLAGVVTAYQVRDWREEMLNRWPHLNICPVWHHTRGREEWSHYCRDQRIRTMCIGSGGETSNGTMRRMVMEAHAQGKPVHGFAMTKLRMLQSVPFDSVDSTSWVMGQKFGTMYVFKDNRFIVMPSDQKHRRKLYWKHFKAIGCDPAKIIADDVSEVRKANVIAWRNLSARYELMQKRMKRTMMEGAGEQLVDFDPRETRIREARAAGRNRPENGVSGVGSEEGSGSRVSDVLDPFPSRESTPSRVTYPKERGT